MQEEMANQKLRFDFNRKSPSKVKKSNVESKNILLHLQLTWTWSGPPKVTTTHKVMIVFLIILHQYIFNLVKIKSQFHSLHFDAKGPGGLGFKP